MGGRVAVQNPQGQKESGMKGRDEAGKSQQKGRSVGKMEGDETGVGMPGSSPWTGYSIRKRGNYHLIRVEMCFKTQTAYSTILLNS